MRQCIVNSSNWSPLSSFMEGGVLSDSQREWRPRLQFKPHVSLARFPHFWKETYSNIMLVDEALVLHEATICSWTAADEQRRDWYMLFGTNNYVAQSAARTSYNMFTWQGICSQVTSLASTRDASTQYIDANMWIHTYEYEHYILLYQKYIHTPWRTCSKPGQVLEHLFELLHCTGCGQAKSSAFRMHLGSIWQVGYHQPSWWNTNLSI